MYNAKLISIEVKGKPFRIIMEGPMMTSSKSKRPGYHLIFRRYRTLPNGTVLDVYDYGLKAWPIWVKD